MPQESPTKSTSETIKEVYARFGVAAYQAQALELGLVNLVTLLHRARGDKKATEDPDAFFESRLTDTMGRLCTMLRDVLGEKLPEGWTGMLSKTLEKRNYIAHHFFRVNATRVYFETGCRNMIRELDECTVQFKTTDTKIETMTKRILQRVGYTDADFERIMREEREAEGLRIAQEAPKRSKDGAGPTVASRADADERMSLAAAQLRGGAFPRLASATWQHTTSANLDDFEPPSIFEAVGVHPSVFSTSERCSLEDLRERVATSPEATAADMQFRWNLLALSSLETVFDAPLMKRSAAGSRGFELALWRFYYLGLFALGEAMLANLNGLRVSSCLELRVFLELNILQNFYYRACCDSDSYDPFDDFVLTGTYPPISESLKHCLPDSGHGPKTRDRLTHVLSNLGYSPTKEPGTTAQELARPVENYWREVCESVDAVLRMYYVNFPMLLHPVDVVRKFGFNGPVGILVDPTVGYSVRKSLSPSEYDTLRRSDTSGFNPKETLEWVAARRDLSDEEILATLPRDEGIPPVTSVETARLLHSVRLSAMRMLMALQPLEVLRTRLTRGRSSQGNSGDNE